MDYLLGQMQLFPFDFVPEGWLLCNGQALQIRQYNALFSLLGINYGGDGKTTFCLPNLANTSPVAGMEYYMCTMGIYPARD
jgi:microcystin-dependent protein